MYYTLDQFIERLASLRSEIEGGGESPVCVLDTDRIAGGSWYPASVEVQNAAQETADIWDLPVHGEDGAAQIISIF